ncbi:MAG: hypothetical protein HOY71_45110 [Nonomuraea sp.]|nr:hypothetical protein [Nonomuraea sp.]
MARAIPPERIVYILLYSVQYERELDDALALTRARALLLEPVEGYTPEEEYALLREAKRPGAELASLLGTPIAIPRTDEEFRDFVLRVLDAMDSLRPWPELPFIPSREPPWPGFAQSPPIALLKPDTRTVETRMHRYLLHAEQGGYWLPLRLNSGDEVALTAPERNAAIKVLMREGSARAPEEVLAAFLHVMPFAPDEVEDLHVAGGAQGDDGGGALLLHHR